MRQLIFLLFIIFTTTSVVHGDESSPTAEEQEQYNNWANELVSRLTPHAGKVELLNNKVTLDVPEGFVYYTIKDTKIVLEEAWKNPPSDTYLGLIMPFGKTPFDDDSWAVTIEYEEDGYVSDEDAGEIDYDELLQQLKDEAQNSNAERIKQGYEPFEVIGWAADPYYDAVNKKLHWAKEIKFGVREQNTLNYNIRVLGRKGVLVLNFIAGMEQLPDIDLKKDTVLEMASFNEGHRYSEFDPSLDEVAAYGIGALVAGKVIAKTGILAVALIFLKKFGIIIVVAIGGFLARLFKGKKSD